MFDLDQTFLSKILFLEQMFWSFSHLCKQSKPKWEKATNQKVNLCDVSAVN